VAAYFFDSSAIFKRYITESGTGWVSGITDPASGHSIYLAAITGVEVVSAFVRQVPPLLQPDLAKVPPKNCRTFTIDSGIRRSPAQ
jgi:hypothetical protein